MEIQEIEKLYNIYQRNPAAFDNIDPAYKAKALKLFDDYNSQSQIDVDTGDYRQREAEEAPRTRVKPPRPERMMPTPRPEQTRPERMPGRPVTEEIKESEYILSPETYTGRVLNPEEKRYLDYREAKQVAEVKKELGESGLAYENVVFIDNFSKKITAPMQIAEAGIAKLFPESQIADNRKLRKTIDLVNKQMKPIEAAAGEITGGLTSLIFLGNVTGLTGSALLMMNTAVQELAPLMEEDISPKDFAVDLAKAGVLGQIFKYASTGKTNLALKLLEKHGWKTSATISEISGAVGVGTGAAGLEVIGDLSKGQDVDIGKALSTGAMMTAFSLVGASGRIARVKDLALKQKLMIDGVELMALKRGVPVTEAEKMVFKKYLAKSFRKSLPSKPNMGSPKYRSYGKYLNSKPIRSDYTNDVSFSRALAKWTESGQTTKIVNVKTSWEQDINKWTSENSLNLHNKAYKSLSAKDKNIFDNFTNKITTSKAPRIEDTTIPKTGESIPKQISSISKVVESKSYSNTHELMKTKYPHRKGRADTKIRKYLKKLGAYANNGETDKLNELLPKFADYLNKAVDTHSITKEKAVNTLNKLNKILEYEKPESKASPEIQKGITETKENPIIDDVINRFYDEDIEKYNEELNIPESKYQFMKKNKQGDLQSFKKRQIVRDRINGAIKELELLTSDRAKETVSILRDMLDAKRTDIKAQKQRNVKDVFAKVTEEKKEAVKPKELEIEDVAKEEVNKATPKEKVESKKPVVEKENKEFQKLIDDIEKRDKIIKVFVDNNEEFSFQAEGSTGKVIVSKQVGKDGWRITYFSSKDGDPVGHSDRVTWAEAVQTAVEDHKIDLTKLKKEPTVSKKESIEEPAKSKWTPKQDLILKAYGATTLPEGIQKQVLIKDKTVSFLKNKLETATENGDLAQMERIGLKIKAEKADIKKLIKGKDVLKLKVEEESEKVEIIKVVGKQGNTEEIITPKGNKHNVKFEVLESKDVIQSTLTNFQDNKNYPKELQPRSRDRAGLKTQVNDMANNLDPKQLVSSRLSKDGSPVIGSNDNFVESGNGRTVAIKLAYEGDKGTAYKQYLVDNAEEFGLKSEDIAKMNDPILVRRRTDKLSDKDRRKFIDESNIEGIAKMSDIEIAASDANNLTDGMLELFNISEKGKIFHAGNRGFVKKFLSDITASSEMNLYVTKEGAYTQALERRISNAIFAKAFPGTEGRIALQFLSEATEDNFKVMTKTLLNLSPTIIKMKHLIEQGNRFNLDISNDIAKAMMKVSNLRTEGISIEEYLSQMDMLDDTDLFVKSLIQVFDKYSRSGKKLFDFFSLYYKTINEMGDPKQGELFGSSKSVTKEDLLDRVNKEVNNVREEAIRIDFGEEGKGESGEVGSDKGIYDKKGSHQEIDIDDGKTTSKTVEISDEVRQKLKEFGFDGGEIKPIEHPELVARIKALTGKYPIVRELRKAWGIYYALANKNPAYSQTIVMSKKAYGSEEQYHKTLAHEFGHLIDDMPLMDSGIKGTVLNKLFGIKDGIIRFKAKKGMSDGEFIKLRKERDSIRRKQYSIAKLIKDQHFKAKGNRYRYTQNELQDKYFALQKELEKVDSQMILDQVLRDELITLSEYWKPIPAGAPEAYVKYRHSAPELYADFISVLFNKPEIAVKIAPESSELFFEYLDKKPAIKKAYFDMINEFNEPIEKILERRGINIKNMIGLDLIDVYFYLQRLAKNSSIENLRLAIGNKWDKINRIDRKLIKEGELNKNDTFENFLVKADVRSDQIMPEKMQKMQDIRLDWIDDGVTDKEISEYLFLSRSATQRKDVANPLGIQERYSLLQLSHLKDKIGEQRYNKIQKHIKALQEWHRNEVIDYMYESGVLKEDLYNTIRNENLQEMELLMPKDIESKRKPIEDANIGRVVDLGEISKEDAIRHIGERAAWKPGIHLVATERDNIYAPFIPPYYFLKSSVSPHIHRVIGNLGKTIDPLHALILKDIAMIKAAYNNSLRRDFANRALQVWKDAKDITDVSKKINRLTGNVQGNPDHGKAYIMYRDKGISKAVMVHRDVALAFKYYNDILQEFLVKTLSMPNTLARAGWVVYNPGYVAFNAVRDFKRTYNAVYQIEKFWKMIPGGSMFIKAKMRWLYWKNMAHAWKGALDISDAKMDKIRNMGMLSGRFTDYLLRMELRRLNSKNAVNKILRKAAGISIKHETKNIPLKMVHKIVWVLEQFKHANDIVENLSPLVALDYFNNDKFIGKGKVFPTKEHMVTYVVKQIGTPAYMIKGHWSKGANATVIFFNMWKSSMAALGEQVRGKTGGKKAAFSWFVRSAKGWVSKALLVMLARGVVADYAEKYRHESDAAEKIYQWTRWYERSLNKISDYNKASYGIIPIGYVDWDNEIHLLLPFAMKWNVKPVNPENFEDIQRTIFIRSPYDEDSRLTNGMAYFALMDEGGLNVASHVLDFGADQIPGLSPVFKILKAVGDLAIGLNPEDTFMGRNIINKQEFENDNYAVITKEMSLWVANSLGLSTYTNILKGAEKANKRLTNFEKHLNVNPIIGRFIKVSSFGTQEALEAAFEKSDKNDLDKKISQRKFIRSFVNKYLDDYGKDKQSFEKMLATYTDIAKSAFHAEANKQAFNEMKNDKTIVRDVRGIRTQLQGAYVILFEEFFKKVGRYEYGDAMNSLYNAKGSKVNKRMAIDSFMPESAVKKAEIFTNSKKKKKYKYKVSDQAGRTPMPKGEFRRMVNVMGLTGMLSETDKSLYLLFNGDISDKTFEEIIRNMVSN